jgi:hypothetical protein
LPATAGGSVTPFRSSHRAGWIAGAGWPIFSTGSIDRLRDDIPSAYAITSGSG